MHERIESYMNKGIEWTHGNEELIQCSGVMMWLKDEGIDVKNDGLMKE